MTLKMMIYESKYSGTDIVEVIEDARRIHGMTLGLDEKFKYLFLRRIGDLLQEFEEEGDNMFFKYRHYIEQQKGTEKSFSGDEGRCSQ